MMKRITLIFFIFINYTSFSQECFVNFGKNTTAYMYKNANGQSNPNLRSGTGHFYEIGYEHVFKKGYDQSTLSYVVSLNLNEFNALGGDVDNNYMWETKYIGIKNALLFTLLSTSRDTFDARILLGFNTSILLDGSQIINNATYNLKNSSEFKGLFVQPMAGIQTRYRITDEMMIGVGYTISKAYNISNTTPEKLSFITNQIAFGLSFKIN
jgi:hypothetical protein